MPASVVDSVYAACGVEAGTLALYCHVVEGARCFRVPLERIDAYGDMYDAGLEAHGLPAELARLLVLVIDPRRIEHACGNGVKLRCRRTGRDARPECAVDWGWGEGWERWGPIQRSAPSSRR